MPKLRLHHAHPWNVTPAAARAIQQHLRERVRMDAALPDDWTTVAGIDVGFEENGKITKAAAVLLRREGLTVVDQAIARRATYFPYVPGLLSFRETPAILDALEQLQSLPDLVLCDGQGLAHPRRFGLASHLGVLLDLPSVGVAKSRLIGTHDDPGPEKGQWSELLDRDGAVIGAVLRTRTKVSPLYVSVGHRVSLAQAIAATLSCTTRYRLPETTRQAHWAASG